MLDRGPTGIRIAAPRQESQDNESVPTIHSAAGRHLAADGGHLLVGIVAYRQLPVSALPEVDYPTIQVMTFYPGASPDVMASRSRRRWSGSSARSG